MFIPEDSWAQLETTVIFIYWYYYCLFIPFSGSAGDTGGPWCHDCTQFLYTTLWSSGTSQLIIIINLSRLPSFFYGKQAASKCSMTAQEDFFFSFLFFARLSHLHCNLEPFRHLKIFMLYISLNSCLKSKIVFIFVVIVMRYLAKANLTVLKREPENFPCKLQHYINAVLKEKTKKQTK